MQNWNRRDFLGAAAAATTLQAQDKKLRLGLIGCGWWGGIDSRAALQAGGVEFTDVCDVDSKMLEDTQAALEKQQGSRPRGHKRYEDLIKAEGLDGVLLCTPPHWHALPFIAICERKIPLYAEKPLAYDIREGQAMVKAWKRTGNLVQVGFQRRQSTAFQQVREYIQSGAAGRIVQVDVNIHYTAGLADPAPQAPPSTLDWEAWLGPAPKMPYSPQVGHRNWRLEKNIGNGHLVDWGAHLIDATRMMLDLGMPARVSATGGLYQYKGRITTPDTMSAHFEFERCPVMWNHRLWGAVERDPEFSNGVTLFGEKETIFVTDQRWIVMPKGRDAKRVVKDTQPPQDLSRLHVAAWLEAVRNKRQPAMDPEEAWRSTATVQLAMISYDRQRSVRWDDKAATITGDPEAARMLARPYRAPFKHPGV